MERFTQGRAYGGGCQPLPESTQAAQDIQNTNNTHDEKTLAALLGGYAAGHSRVCGCLPPGTGSAEMTKLGWAAAERLAARRVAAFFSSVRELRAALGELLREGAPVRVLVVAGESGDGRAVHPITDSRVQLAASWTDVRRFLEEATAASVSLVCATYEAASVAPAGSGVSFDLGVFCDASFAAEHAKRAFGLLLTDEHIKLAKRLTLTHSLQHRRMTRKSTRLVYSLEDEALFGRCVYRRRLEDAVRRGLLTDYRLIVSIVTTPELTTELLRLGLAPDTESQLSRRIMAQLALRRACEAYPAKRVAVFHDTNSAAKHFIDFGGRKLEAYLPQHQAFILPAGAADDSSGAILSAFTAAEQGLLSTAEPCLHAVSTAAAAPLDIEMAAFMNQQRGGFKLIAAIGEILRPGRELGQAVVRSLVVPLFLPTVPGEAMGAALCLRRQVGDVRVRPVHRRRHPFGDRDAVPSQLRSLVRVVREQRRPRRLEGVSPWVSLAAIAGWTALALWVLRRRIRPVEVVS